MFREHMLHEQYSEFSGSNFVSGRDEYGLLRESIHNYQDGSVKAGCGELFDEIHGDGFPRSGRNRELLEGAVWLVSGGLCSTTASTRSYKVDYIGTNLRPDEVASDELEGFGLAGMARELVVVLELENAGSEIVSVGNVNTTVKK